MYSVATRRAWLAVSADKYPERPDGTVLDNCRVTSGCHLWARTNNMPADKTGRFSCCLPDPQTQVQQHTPMGFTDSAQQLTTPIQSILNCQGSSPRVRAHHPYSFKLGSVSRCLRFGEVLPTIGGWPEPGPCIRAGVVGLSRCSAARARPFASVITQCRLRTRSVKHF